MDTIAPKPPSHPQGVGRLRGSFGALLQKTVAATI